MSDRDRVAARLWGESYASRKILGRQTTIVGNTVALQRNRLRGPSFFWKAYQSVGRIAELHPKRRSAIEVETGSATRGGTSLPRNAAIRPVPRRAITRRPPLHPYSNVLKNIRIWMWRKRPPRHGWSRRGGRARGIMSGLGAFLTTTTLMRYVLTSSKRPASGPAKRQRGG
jgi:hypothetical protein